MKLSPFLRLENVAGRNNSNATEIGKNAVNAAKKTSFSITINHATIFLFLP